jgi:YhcN/YlaJ family sporulation lipoprotein
VNNKRKILFILFTVIFMFSVVVATACNPARRPGPTQPAPTPPAPVAPTEDTTKARALAEKISDLKNINSATVVVSGNKAWVGVDLAAKMENKMTNAMKNEITKLVKKEDKNITTVYVTADADTVTRLRNIAKDIAAGKPISGFINELNEIGRRITPSAK